MSDIDWLKIVKWVFIVLVAGFIGQFGKMLANHFASRAKLKKKRTPQMPAESGPDRVIEESEKDTAKEEKKLLKARTKQQKKEAKALQKQNEL